MRKRAPSLTLLAALTASLGACDDPAAQRDVYAGPDAFERCVADWGNEDLCQKRQDDAEKAAHAKSQGGGHDNSTVFIMGPSYLGERVVNYGGQTYQPAATRATSTANFTNSSGMKPASFSSPRPAFTGTPSVRGGFGATGSVSSGG